MELKEYQISVLEKLDHYLQLLDEKFNEASDYVEFQKSRGRDAQLTNYCADTWEELNNQRKLPYLYDQRGGAQVAPYKSRYDGLDNSIPNVCFRVPTGGGKTLLAAASIERIQTDYFKQQTGFVLWVVPSDSIYKQTWKHLANREHPYRQMLERASGGRVKLLEKGDAFTKHDVDHQLCVMLLMLQSSSRQTKDTLRMFRDNGNFTTFFPEVDDMVANEDLHSSVRNLDTNDLVGADLFSQTTSIKMSLGNVLRLVRPVVVIDEGHKAYSDTARDTLCGFNPKFILELSATPNAKGKHQSNVLVNVPGKNLKDEQMIKIPINVINEDGSDWKHTLSASFTKLEDLQTEATSFQSDTGRYIRPIMVIRVERTGKDKRDEGFVHTEDVREYLIEHLGVAPNAIREKTASADELGDDDLLSEFSPVRFIITKDALREGWDCPFAYVLTILSKMTAQTALTQMVGRVLRQPHAQFTGRSALDECYIYTFDQVVDDAVNGVKRGLEEEGMGDLAGYVHGKNDDGEDTKDTWKETIGLRDKFKALPQVFLPRVLHKDDSEIGYREFDYERDILGNLDWEQFKFSDADKMMFTDEQLHRTVARIGFGKSKGVNAQLGIDLEQQDFTDYVDEPLDEAFLVRQMLDVVPNPWQCMRILSNALAVIRDRGVTEEQLFVGRLDLLKALKKDIKLQVSEASEELFNKKLAEGELSLRLVSPKESEINWRIAEEIEVQVNEDDRPLKKRNGEELERTLYEKVYERGVNNLEKQSAWYLDSKEAVHWWHRIAVNQREYSLQGWQKQKVYPDLLVCLNKEEKGVTKFALLETKGEHLKGNDDTEYKRKLFDILTQSVEHSIQAGELELEMAAGGMSFQLLLEDDWKQELIAQGIV